jgi:hypothetical protein
VPFTDVFVRAIAQPLNAVAFTKCKVCFCWILCFNANTFTLNCHLFSSLGLMGYPFDKHTGLLIDAAMAKVVALVECNDKCACDRST